MSSEVSKSFFNGSSKIDQSLTRLLFSRFFFKETPKKSKGCQHIKTCQSFLLLYLQCVREVFSLLIIITVLSTKCMQWSFSLSPHTKVSQSLAAFKITCFWIIVSSLTNKITTWFSDVGLESVVKTRSFGWTTTCVKTQRLSPFLLSHSVSESSNMYFPVDYFLLRCHMYPSQTPIYTLSSVLSFLISGRRISFDVEYRFLFHFSRKTALLSNYHWQVRGRRFSCVANSIHIHDGVSSLWWWLVVVYPPVANQEIVI